MVGGIQGLLACMCRRVISEAGSLIQHREASLVWKTTSTMTTVGHILTRRRRNPRIHTNTYPLNKGRWHSWNLSHWTSSSRSGLFKPQSPRVTSKQVAVAGTNSKDIKAALPSRCDIPACLAVGRFLAERAREADVYTASYTPRERDKFEGKIRAVVQSIIDNRIDIKVYLD